MNGLLGRVLGNTNTSWHSVWSSKRVIQELSFHPSSRDLDGSLRPSPVTLRLLFKFRASNSVSLLDGACHDSGNPLCKQIWGKQRARNVSRGPARLQRRPTSADQSGHKHGVLLSKYGSDEEELYRLTLEEGTTFSAQDLS